MGTGDRAGDGIEVPVSWRDGCAPRPPVEAGADVVLFDFAAADAMGDRLDALRRAVVADRGARAGAAPLLSDWTGPHRAAYDEQRAAHEGILGHHDLEIELRRLRTAWDEAARAQRRANVMAARRVVGPPI